jgi:hypothetical protein
MSFPCFLPHEVVSVSSGWTLYHVVVVTAAVTFSTAHFVPEGCNSPLSTITFTMSFTKHGNATEDCRGASLFTVGLCARVIC